jgi:hypothetical protein
MAEERRIFCTGALLIVLGVFLLTTLTLALASLPLLECYACQGTGNYNSGLPVKLRTQNPPPCRNCDGSCRVTPLNRGWFELEVWLAWHNLVPSQGCRR